MPSPYVLSFYLEWYADIFKLAIHSFSKVFWRSPLTAFLKSFIHFCGSPAALQFYRYQTVHWTSWAVLQCLNRFTYCAKAGWYQPKNIYLSNPGWQKTVHKYGKKWENRWNTAVDPEKFPGHICRFDSMDIE